MARLILSNLVLAYVAFLLGTHWPQEQPRAVVLRYPPPNCQSELERLRQENDKLTNQVRHLSNELASREDITFIVRETVRILLEGEPKP